MPQRLQATEAQIQAAICHYLDLCGYLYSITDASRSFGRDGKPRRSKVATGWPDITVILPGGRVAAVEVKSASGRLRPEQKVTLAKFAELGAVVIVARSVEDVVAVLKGK